MDLFEFKFENAFCLVFDLSGQIKYVSDDIMHHLGYHPVNKITLAISIVKILI